jgi:CBS domain-containing protein
MINVSDILRSKGPQFNKLEGNTRVADALTIMNSEGLNYVIVTKSGEYAGIFVEKDYTKTVTLMGTDSRGMFIDQLVSKDLPVVDVDVSLESCYRLMTAYKTNHLPVFDSFNFMGVVTMNDVVNKMMVNQAKV